MDVAHFKFLDESGVNLSMTRLYGRAAPDQRVVESTPLPSGPRTTTLAVIGAMGITAPLVLSGAVNGHIFYGYIEACGAHLIYLPPYSSDFNPIELAWSKVKTILRRLKARTFPALIKALKQALLAITTQDVQGWFAHCGYAIN
jgi:hypothetical protein